MGTQIRQIKKKGPSGKATISVLPVSAAKTPDKWKEVKVSMVRSTGEKEVFRLTPEGLTTEFGGWTLTPTADVFVQLTGEETNIQSVRPFEGNFLFKFDRFAARPEKAPTIKFIPMQHVGPLPNGSEWDNPPHHEFYAVLRIAATEIGKKTPFEGMEVIRNLVYQFQRNPVTGLMDIAWERKFWYDALVNFLNVTGFDWDADSLTPSENVLGELEDILQKRGKIIRGTLVNGYLKGELQDAPIGVTVK